LEALLKDSSLQVLARRRVGPFGYWTMVQTLNDKPRRKGRTSIRARRDLASAALR
jgi:hypothetical protein